MTTTSELMAQLEREREIMRRLLAALDSARDHGYVPRDQQAMIQARGILRGDIR